jgi:hypothetical protein
MTCASLPIISNASRRKPLKRPIMEQAELAAINARAEAEFMKIPGVLGVGYGLKEIGGTTTRQPSIQVYVREKKPAEAIPPAEMIPAEFEGIPTDVMVAPSLTLTPCEDQEQHSPLIGGIVITNFKQSPPGQVEMGTLGFFATLNGVAGPENVVLVSNKHVLLAKGAVVGDAIYHPRWSSSSGSPKPVADTGAIGKIHGVAFKENVKYKYGNEPEGDYFLDCAMAKLDISVSSWCKTNCGVSYKNAVRILNINGNSKFEGFERAKQADVDAANYEVYKVGARTSRTKGLLTGVNVTSATGDKGLMRIEVIGVDCDNIAQFNAKGDSGSAIINSQNKIVALLFAVDTNDIRKAYASHIHPVIDKLGITPISTANPPVGPAGEALSNIEGIVDGIDESIELRARMLATPRGEEIYALMLGHRAEVVGLVNHRRPVTIAWHRSKGPAFVAHAINNVRDPDHRIPLAIDGVDRAELLERMADSLIEHGSPQLARTIRSWRPFVLDHLNEADDLHALVRRLELEPVDG